MSALPSALYTTSGLRELEHRAMEDAGVAAAELMRRAGAAAWEFLTVQWPEARKLVVLCGAGNNAGEGYVVASQALEAQRGVTVLTVGDPARLPAIAADARRAYLKAGGIERS